MMGGPSFILPTIPPDFGVMGRDELEDYAAEVDFRLRNLLTEYQSRESEFAAFQQAIKLAHPDFKTLTKSEVSLLLALGPTCTSNESLYGLLCELNQNSPEPAILKVLISKIRRKLKPLGLKISTDWGRGYIFDDSDLLTAMINHWAQTGVLPKVECLPPARVIPRSSPAIEAQRRKIGDLRQRGRRVVEIADLLDLSETEVARAITCLRHRGERFPDLRIHSNRASS